MRGIAERAGVATGAAYYYYPSKDAIVMDFYKRAWDGMQDDIRQIAERVESVEAGLNELIRIKLTHFTPNRDILRALLRSGADPKNPLSPFSVETKPIRDTDIAWFERVIKQAGVRVPRDLRSYLPGLLWFFQMGVILFWITDDSPHQSRTERLLPLACRLVSSLIRFSSIPLMRPLRRPLVDLIGIVAGENL